MCGSKQVIDGIKNLGINWLTSSEDDRKALYAAARDVGAVLNLSVEQVIDAALGRQAPIGTGYVDNFRKGKIRRSFAKLIYEWMRDNHASLAHASAPHLFPLQHTNAWQAVLDDHAIKGQLRLLPFEKTMGLIQRSDQRQATDITVSLGEEFCFQLDQDREGYAVGFQIYEGVVHFMPLGPQGEDHMRVQTGRQPLPLNGHGKPIPLSEDSDLGPHRFVICIGDKVSELPTPTEPPAGDHGKVSIHVLDVSIKP